MNQILDGLNEVIARYDAVFCDVWGVLHNGQSAHADACEALMQARLNKKFVSLVTNSPKTPNAVRAQLSRLGVPDTAYDDVITAGQAMQYSLFGTKFKKAYFIGSEEDRVLFTDPPEGVKANVIETSDYKEADVIVCAGPDYGTKDSPDDYALELQQLWSRKLQMFCGNPDVFVDRGQERIWCGGAIAAAYERLGGTVFQFGKPFPPIYQLARQRMKDQLDQQISASHILFIGDGVDTDLKGATLEDMDVCFVAGGLAAKESGMSDGHPDEAKLADYLSAHHAYPNYTIGTLRW